MYLTRSEYDRGVNTFSPEGRLFQVTQNLHLLPMPLTISFTNMVVMHDDVWCNNR
jgi:20S proteasome alpha/beta subunit